MEGEEEDSKGVWEEEEVLEAEDMIMEEIIIIEIEVEVEVEVMKEVEIEVGTGKEKEIETKWKDYNFPHIYLSDKDIKEFNNKCVELGIDLKVVPIAEYMNLNKPEKKEDNIDEEKMDDKMEKIDKAMEHLSKNFLPDKKKKCMNKINQE